jgi:hypothetical protein
MRIGILFFLLYKLAITGYAQNCPACDAVCEWLPECPSKPNCKGTKTAYSGSCYYNGLFEYRMLHYENAILISEKVFDRDSIHIRTMEWRKGEITSDSVWDVNGRLEYTVHRKRKYHETIRNYKNGKLVNLEKGLARYWPRDKDRKRTIEWDSLGKKKRVAFSVIRTEYYSPGYKSRGCELVLRENGKPCFRIRRIRYEKKPYHVHW